MSRDESFSAEVAARVKACALRAPTFTDLVKEIGGPHPTQVRRLLVETNPRLLDQLLAAEPSQRNFIIKVQDNPTLSAWYFTNSTNRMLSGLFDWRSKSVGLLGTPGILLAALEEQRVQAAHLYDLEPPSLLKPDANVHIHAQNIDVVLPKSVQQRFDVIYVDSPWYVKEQMRWLSLAMQWLNPGGTIVSSIWPMLLRPTAEEERATIFEYLSRAGASIDIRPSTLEYEVPSFEAGQLVHNGLPVRPWKTADLLIANFASDPRPVVNMQILEAKEVEWREVRCAGIRFFLRWGDKPEYDAQLVRQIDSSSPILESPSMRSGRANANVLSSMGHGLKCANNQELMDVLITLSIRGESGLAEIDSIDRRSLEILNDVFRISN